MTPFDRLLVLETELFNGCSHFVAHFRTPDDRMEGLGRPDLDPVESAGQDHLISEPELRQDVAREGDPPG